MPPRRRRPSNRSRSIVFDTPYYRDFHPKLLKLCRERFGDRWLVGKRCWDLGCGVGNMAALLVREGVSSILGLESQPENIHQAMQRCPQARYLDCDLSYVDLPKDPVDVLFMIDVLHCLRNPLWAVREVSRILKAQPGRMLLLEARVIDSLDPDRFHVDLFNTLPPEEHGASNEDGPYPYFHHGARIGHLLSPTSLERRFAEHDVTLIPVPDLDSLNGPGRDYTWKPRGRGASRSELRKLWMAVG